MGKTKKNWARLKVVDPQSITSLTAWEARNWNFPQWATHGAPAAAEEGVLQTIYFFFFLFFSSTGLLCCWSLAQIAARWRYRLPIKNLTLHYNSQFCVIFNFCIDVYMGPKQNLVNSNINGGVFFIKSRSSSHQLYAWNRCNGNPISTFLPCYGFHISTDVFHCSYL